MEPVSKEMVLCSAFTSADFWNTTPVRLYPDIKDAAWNPKISSTMAIPKGERIAPIFIANGEPTQRAVTNTDSGGRKGWIALQNLGKNLSNAQEMEY